MREWLLEQWEKEKKTVCFITHDVEEAVFLSSRILVVEESPITTSAVHRCSGRISAIQGRASQTGDSVPEGRADR
ncbi:MAG: hypothetical protein ACLR8P_03625 [Clostridium fessum]